MRSIERGYDDYDYTTRTIRDAVVEGVRPLLIRRGFIEGGDARGALIFSRR
jgi:hypothetical protein